MSDLEILPIERVTLAFGLTWLPNISRSASRAAKRYARQYRASHMIVASDDTAAIGLATLRAGRSRRLPEIFSAAQAVAVSCASGTVALILELRPQRHWLLVVHEGAVVARTDKIYATDEEARLALNDVSVSYPQLVVLDGTQPTPSMTLETIALSCEGRSRLIQIDRWRRNFPTGGVWLAALSLLVLAIARFMGQPGLAKEAPVAISAFDGEQAWKNAIAAAERRTLIHGVQGTQRLLSSLYDLPVRIKGWILASASCDLQGSAWQCRARYERRESAARNADLLAAAPEPWRLEFSSLDVASAQWSLETGGRPLNLHDIRSVQENEKLLLSSLQTVRPAFTQIRLGTPAPLAIETPLNADGQQPIPMPTTLRRYLSRSFTVEGPLRSISVLLPYTANMAWQHASVVVREQSQPGLTRSSIHTSFRGTLYEHESDARLEMAAGDDAKSAAFLEAEENGQISTEAVATES